ncbi:uncharacterized protein LOC144448279 [Glandiceps talaboti]
MATAQDLQIISEESLDVIDEVIGGGAFAEVYIAMHKDWQIKVAVKKCYRKIRMQKSDQEMILEEAKKLSMTNHQNIVRLFGLYTNPRYYGLVMEYMINGPLDTLLATDVHLPWCLRCRFVLETCLGMNYLHKIIGLIRILHLDLKAANLLLDEFLTIKIADFGMARLKTLTQTITSSKGGTITHIPPEYLEDPNKKANEKFDVYSFAVVIWEILTREDPYQEAVSNLQLQLAIVSNEARPDETLIPSDSPAELVAVMKRCWQQNPKRRPDFRDILPDLKKLVEGFRENMQMIAGEVLQSLEHNSGVRCRTGADTLVGAMMPIQREKPQPVVGPRRGVAEELTDVFPSKISIQDEKKTVREPFNRDDISAADKKKWESGQWKVTMTLNGKSGPVKFKDPNGVTTTHLGQVVIAATESHSVLTFNSKYDLDSQIRFDGKFPKEFKPLDVAVTTTNKSNIYFMSDIANHQVVVYQQNSKTTQIFCQHDNINPEWIALLHEGFVVTDSKGKRVVKYDMNGESVAEVKGQGQKGQIINPQGVVVNSVNNVLVSDWCRGWGDGSIKVYNDQLHFLFSLVDGLYSPYGLSVDLWDNVYSIQSRLLRGSLRGCIVKYTKNGEEVEVVVDNLDWGYIAVCKHHNDPRIIVSKPFYNCIQVYTK